jgi:hypothetical protein
MNNIPKDAKSGIKTQNTATRIKKQKTEIIRVKQEIKMYK